jgi:hypothetical protein
MRMTRRQFDSAVDRLLAWSAPSDDDERERHARIVSAALAVIKHRNEIPDDVDFDAPPEPELRAMIREFLTGITPIQRKRLKRIAESLELQSEPLH